MGNVQLNLFPGGVENALVVSYDDGAVADLRLIEVFNKNRIKGTFHLCSGWLGQSGRVTAEDVKGAYVGGGHEVSVHTVSHPFLTDVPCAEALREIADDKAALESAGGVIVRGMSYPFGAYNAAVIEAAKAAGMEYARVVGDKRGYYIPDDFLTWTPNCHHNNDALNRFKSYLNDRSKYDRQRLGFFFMWGHS